MSLFSQERRVRQEVEKKGILYNKELSIGYQMNTFGWFNIFGERSKILNIKKTRVFQFGFSEIRPTRQRRQPGEFTFLGPSLESPRDFFFGKQNNFYALRFAYGYRHTLADMAEKNGVRVSLTYLAGFSLGILKPYYLDLAYPLPSNNPNVLVFQLRSERYSEDNESKFLDWFSIAGASPWRLGLGELQPVPGGYGKLGLHFDWNRKEQLLMALETGITVDAYYKKVPIMVDRNRFLFVGAYISFQMGKRW